MSCTVNTQSATQLYRSILLIQGNYGLDFTLVKIKEDAATKILKIIEPFDLTPTPVIENDQLYVIQYPIDPNDHDEQQLKLSASPCKKVIGKSFICTNTYAMYVACMHVYVCVYVCVCIYAEYNITVGHWPFSNQVMLLHDRSIQPMVSHLCRSIVFAAVILYYWSL